MNAETKIKAGGVHRKLSTARQKFHALALKKSGKNTFAGYEYFELGDFLVPALKVFDEVGLGATISFDRETATMTIVDLDRPEDAIVITSPMGSAALKGCHEVQNIGAVETYQRRYLWVAALEIVEHDALDKTTGKAEPERAVETTADENDGYTGPKGKKTELRNAINSIMRGVQRADSNEAVNAMLKKHKDTIERAEREWPQLIDGDKLIEGSGLKVYVQRRRAELAGSVSFQFLMSLVEESQTQSELQNIAAKHGGAIDELDDVERRRFEARFDEREAALAQLDKVTGGA